MIADISSGTIFFHLVGNVIFVAMSIYDFDQALQNIDSYVSIGVFGVAFGLCWSFVLCYSASLSSDVVASVGDIVYDGNWSKYPLVYRKYILLMILRSETAAHFTGFKLVRCNLETFTKVRSFIR